MKFNLFCIKITVSYPAIAFVCLAMFSSYNGNTMIPLCILSSLIHEIGHLVFICIFAGMPDSISIHPGEVKININLTGVNFFQDTIITIAGIAFNLITSILCFVIYKRFNSEALLDFCICNLCIGVFNFLPVKTFDGGQLLSILLSRKFSTRTTDFFINILTALVVIPVAVASFYVLLASKFNYTLLIIAMYAIFIIISKEMR